MMIVIRPATARPAAAIPTRFAHFSATARSARRRAAFASGLVASAGSLESRSFAVTFAFAFTESLASSFPPSGGTLERGDLVPDGGVEAGTAQKGTSSVDGRRTRGLRYHRAT